MVRQTAPKVGVTDYVASLSRCQDIDSKTSLEYMLDRTCASCGHGRHSSFFTFGAIVCSDIGELQAIDFDFGFGLRIANYLIRNHGALASVEFIGPRETGGDVN
jgi:hypothetical protein